ncbi:2-dehydropantoate 2-reductase [Paenibacillus lycopersici]|uniref:2-dehydropantoate 2-reductase n=1 Tax=Paenibacillus lycopersici TaxID=2704462 RepID=A0A6C0G5I4_9BACL|nr:2-dehydropantoate 2-reductase [Paenibacillus lycopersici]QHT60335.1 2-dehydropantoate 2-reductase [Paenibacillus lycopersici]
MKYTVVGAGAIGLLYAARLAMAGEEVLVVTRTDEQAQSLMKKGLLFKDASGAEHGLRMAAQPVSRFSAAGGPPAFAPGCVLLAVKQPHISEELLRGLRRIVPAGVPLLALQNGIGHLERLRDALPHSAVYAAITTEGALRPDMRSVIHTGIGQLTFGGWTPDNLSEGDSDAQKMLLHALIHAGIQAILSNDMKDQVFLKLLINAVVNPLTAIFQVKNGELPRDAYRARMMRALHDESVAILRAAGMAGHDGLWERLLEVCAATAANESSMLRDVRAGRATEISWINGGIIRYAERLGLPSRMNEAVLALVEALNAS